jgi:translation initiation factor IF-3
MPVDRGLQIAQDAGLDLVEVAPSARPPVCRIMDYSKFKYEQQKKERQARKKQKVIHMKEIKLRPKIDDHDYQVKLLRLKKFIEKKDKVKVTMFYKGRERAHMELGRELLDKIVSECSGFTEIESAPSVQGRTMSMVLKPK